MSSVVCRSAPVPMKSYTFSRHSNSAGAPLPSIPRRSSSRSITTVKSVFSSWEVPKQAASYSLVKATSQDLGESMISFPAQLDKAQSKPIQPPELPPPEQSAPSQVADKAHLNSLQSAQSSEALKIDDNVPPRSSRPTKSAPRKGRNSISMQIKLDPVTSPKFPSPTLVDLVVPASAEAHLCRKKSGEPLKSSLKSKTPVARGDLPFATGSRHTSSRSEPTTPRGRSKSVQFAEQLERVKLFLVEQKPLAVSREGSLPDDTSGTDSDFPLSMPAPRDDRWKEKNLVMEILNMPKRRPYQAEVVLEDLSLSSDSTIHGHVKVRNLAYQKWIAVRFTFDLWQTTSEVTAKYVQSLDGGAFDRFSFQIRIHDMLPTIEEKMLVIAIRYSVHGREIWDNNSGENYRVTFAVARKSKSTAQLLQENSGPAHNTGITVLNNRLEQIVDGKNESLGYFLTSGRQEAKSTAVTPCDTETFSFNSDQSLSSRYDFSASLKDPWKPIDFPRMQSHISHSRTNTYPSPSSPGIPWPQKRTSRTPTMKFHTAQFTRGSPRIDCEDGSVQSASIIQDQDIDVVANDLSVYRLPRHAGDKCCKRGYLDIVRPETYTGSRSDTGINSRCHSFPPASPTSPMKNFELSIPELIAESTSPSSSDTGSLLDNVTEYSSPDGSDTTGSPRSDMALFLNKFCFYTGSKDISDDQMQRSHSASSMEQFLYSSQPQASSPLSPYHTFVFHRQPPLLRSRSSSLDDVANLSGTFTPTPGRIMSPLVQI